MHVSSGPVLRGRCHNATSITSKLAEGMWTDPGSDDPSVLDRRLGVARFNPMGFCHTMLETGPNATIVVTTGWPRRELFHPCNQPGFEHWAPLKNLSHQMWANAASGFVDTASRTLALCHRHAVPRGSGSTKVTRSEPGLRASDVLDRLHSVYGLSSSLVTCGVWMGILHGLPKGRFHPGFVIGPMAHRRNPSPCVCEMISGAQHRVHLREKAFGVEADSRVAS